MSGVAIVPPQNREAEEAVLGAMLLSLAAVDAALEGARLRPEDFYLPRHALICEGVAALYRADGAIDPLTVADELERRGKLDDAGGRELLAALASSTPAPGNAGHYAAIVVEKARLRRTLALAQRIERQIASHEGEAAELLETVEAEALELLGGAEDEGAVHVAELLQGAVERYERRAAGEEPGGLPTGFSELDRKLGGLGAGRLVLLAGRPGQGKSTLAINIADHAARRERKGVLLFSLEMSSEEITDKLLQSRGRLHGARLARGELDPEEAPRLIEAANQLHGSPLYIDDTASLTLPVIRQRCRRLRAQLGAELGLIVIDYLQLIEPSRRLRDANRVAEVSEISRELKILAGSLGVPVLACAQLNRQPELRASRRPVLSDLRESGSLENDSNQVVLLYNPALYEDADGGDEDPFADEGSAGGDGSGAVQAIVAKNRHGETGTCELVFEGQYSRFLGLERAA